MHALILAGGYATRLWPLTEKRAKPLLPLAGKPILTHLLERIPKDIPVTVSTNAVFTRQFEEWRNAQSRPVHLEIEETRSDDEKLGTNGAVAQWITKERIEDDVLLLTGDNYVEFQLEHVLAAYTPGNPLVVAQDIGAPELASQYGTVILHANGKTVSAFEEKPKEPKTSLVSTGCSVLPKSLLKNVVAFAAHRPDNIGSLFEEFLKEGQAVECFTTKDRWFDVGSFASYLEATRTVVGNQVLLGTGAALEGTECKGSVVIGPGCTVKDSVLENVVLFANGTVEGCELVSCVLDEQCSLQNIHLRGKMLRAGTSLRRP